MTCRFLPVIYLPESQHINNYIGLLWPKRHLFFKKIKSNVVAFDFFVVYLQLDCV